MSDCPGHRRPGRGAGAGRISPLDEATDIRHNGPPHRRALWAVVVPLIIMVIGGYLSTALLGALVDKHPLWLIGLSASNRNLVLAGKYAGTLGYFTVGTLRLLAPDPLFYLLGYWYGDAAVRWMERKSPSYGQLLRSLERLFGKAGYPLVFIVPNNPICLFAGASAMPVVPFLVVDIAGTVTRLWLLRMAGDVFNVPLDAVRSFIADHRVAVIAVSVVLVLITVLSERSKGKGQASALAHLEEDLGDEAGHDLDQKGAD